MSQFADIQTPSLEEILEILRCQAQSMTHSPTSSRYLRALESFESTIIGMAASPLRFSPMERAAGLSQGETAEITPPGTDAPYCEADTQNDRLSLIINNLYLSLTDWLANLWLIGTPFSTASLYLDIISSLYGSAVKAGQLSPTGIFTAIKADLKALGPQ